MIKRILVVCAMMSMVFVFQNCSYAAVDREAKREKEVDELQKRFEWWPTDAKPGPVEDKEKGGYWWWPTEPGKVKLWGNRGYVYVRKIIFDYKEDELPPAKPQEMRAALLVRKIIRNVKVYFDYDKADLRDDAREILVSAVRTLGKNPDASILITGSCDIRGSEAYNEKLGKRRGETVKEFMLDNGIGEDRIKIVSRGKLDAIAPVTDLVGMQKDRNAQFMIAEVQEVMMPHPGARETAGAEEIEEGKFIVEEVEKVESEVQVRTEEYIVQKGDTLSGIAQARLGAGHRWKYLYEVNKDRIKDPNKLKAGQRIIIPVE
ncbi:MAG: OmpA family protein [Candidatus Omnitrophota bacterium]